jgi:diketogulonate reductase-like aldo/keto reductase
MKIMVTAYAPLGSSSFGHKTKEHKELNLFTEKVIVDIAKKYDKTAA